MGPVLNGLWIRSWQLLRDSICQKLADGTRRQVQLYQALGIQESLEHTRHLVDRYSVKFAERIPLRWVFLNVFYYI